MLRNYLTVAVRNLLRHKGYSAINIAGLAVGMACCILILMFVQYELSYDRFHKKTDQIYRVIQETRMSGADPTFSEGTGGALAPALLREFPEVQQAVRMWRGRAYMLYGDKDFAVVTCLTDKNFFDVFTFPFLKGDPKTSLREPYSAVITEATARKCFGDADPVGKMITLGNYIAGEYRITGVLKDVPENSTFRFDFLTTTVTPKSQGVWDNWIATELRSPVQTFVVLPKGYNIAAMKRKFPDLIEKYMGKEAKAQHIYHLQPLTRIQLYSGADYGITWYGDISRVRLLSAIAFFILLIACINFMNLTTARSSRRAREVGLRKVVGAQRGQLVRQFLGESMLLSFLALVLAVGLAELTSPAFRDLVGGRPLTLNADTYLSLLPGMLGVALLTGFLAGVYPAFYLSAFQPVEVLKGTLKSGMRGAWLRKGLVVFQFSVSIFMIIGTSVTYRQLEYIRNKNLGFNKDHLLIVPIFGIDLFRGVSPEARLSARYNLVKHEFSQNLNIQKVSAFRYLPGDDGGGRLRVVRPEGVQGTEWQMLVNEVDEDFLETFQIKLIAGRNFSTTIASDFNAFILNETAVKKLGWTDPIGKQFEWVETGKKGTVIGVVKDFHNGSLREQIGPLALSMRTSLVRHLAIRIRGEDVSETMAFLEKKWKQFVPRQPFDYDFMNDTLGWMYGEEMRLSRVAGFSSLLAIFVACLGLFGLASFTAERRTKEIGIRKVLGASVPDIVALLSKDFLKLVIAANLIAWPVAYWIAEKWLQNFAYRMNVGIGIFALAGGLALGIALLTVSAQAVQAALANPVEALRNE